MSLIDILLHHTGLHLSAQFDPNPNVLAVMAFFAMLIATSIHMFGHALMADFLGDGTPRAQGRVSLAPFAHLDPLGLLVLIVTSLFGFPIGWGGKPVRMNPKNFRCGPKVGMGLVAAAGPAANLLTAIALSPLARWILGGGMGVDDRALWCLLGVFLLMLINLSLFAFNLFVPVTPMDGCYIVASLLPDDISAKFSAFMARYGYYILIGLIYSEVLGKAIAPIIFWIFFKLIGMG